MSYYRRHEGTLFPGKIAKSEDIHHIQTNIDDAIRAVIADQYDHSSFILGSRENAFLLSPAPKRYGRYVDTQNLVESGNEIWLDIDSYGYRQAIKTSKSSLYSIIVKMRNLYTEPQDVSFELWSEDAKISKQTVTVPAQTSGAEFEVVFGLEHFSTQHGRTPEELEKPDAKFIAKPGIERKEEQKYDIINSPDNNSVGATTLYLVVKAIYKATEIITSNNENTELIDENTFMICADSTGSYGELLERTADDGRNYESTKYDLYFKDVYSNAPTYLCTGGEAVVNGSPTICNDTHVVVDGASTGGHTKSYIAMDEWGQLKSYTSNAYWGDESNAIFDTFPNGDLIIAIIYTYNGDIKQPKIVQDDNLIEHLTRDTNGNQEYGIPIRQRTHHERIRRLEKEMAYQRDITIPSRLKYNLTGEDVVDAESKSDNGSISVSTLNVNQQLTTQVTDAQKAVDWSKYYIATDAQGNFIVKSVDAETEQIPVTLKESPTIEGKTGIKLAQTIVSKVNTTVNEDEGTATLSEYEVEEGTPQSAYKVGLTAKEAEETKFNPWDDNAANRPETIDIKPTERIFTTKKGVNGVNVRSSEYPAMTLYLDNTITLKELVIPVVKFQNVDTVQFHIWKRQGPNNQTNTVWLEKLIYSSEKFSLKNAKTKDGYQILDEPFKIAPEGGLKLTQHQYIILVQIVPKSGDGSVYIETYKPKESTDFLIRYHGSADCAHFRLKERYREVWYTSSQTEIKAYVNKHYLEGRIESGEVVWENSEPIVSVTPSMNATIPDGCSIDLYANVGNGWKKLTNDTATKITGGTSSFKWRAIFKGTDKNKPTITYDDEKKYAINFTVVKDKPLAGTANAADTVLDNKNVLTTKTFYPGDILQKYIGDTNLNTCNKFSNYEWIRVFGSDNGEAKAVIDIAASDSRITIDPVTKAVTTTHDNVSCSSTNPNEYDIFTLYYADLTLDDFVTESVDYSNYDANIEYDEHNLRFKIDTDRAYNDDDVFLFNIQDGEAKVDNRDESLVTVTDNVVTDTNPPVTINPNENYLTVHFTNFETKDDNLYSEDNSFIWKKTMPGDSTIDLSNYSALKIGYKFTEQNADESDSLLKGIGLYISSAVEEIAPSNNNDKDSIINGKNVREYEEMAPATLETSELEKYKSDILKVSRVKNGVTYTEYYYYSPDENGIWRRHQYHDIKTFNLYAFPEFSSSITSNDSKNVNYIMITIDKENENFKHVKEIGLVVLSDAEKATGLTAINSSELQLIDIKGVVQGYNTIYSANEPLKTNQSEHIVKHGLYQDQSGQTSSISRIYYNRLSSVTNTQLAYLNNYSITTDANNFAMQFVSDTYIPKDSIYVHLCAEENGVSPIYTLNMPTLNHVFYDSNLDLPDLFDLQSETDKIYQIDYTKEDYKGAEITKEESETAYSITNTLTEPTLPSGKTEKDFTTIEYKVSIEPAKTTLNINEDRLEWNVYRQLVTIKDGKTTYGDKEYINKIYNAQGTATETPKLQVQIQGQDKTDTFLSYSTTGTGNEAVTTDLMNADETTIGAYGIKCDYNPGQYKIKIGFQGYKVLVNNSTDTANHNKIIKYRSAETEFTVSMYWRIKNVVNFAQVYKKINENQEIKSISIETSPKFRDYMNTVRGTTATDANACVHLFIKNIVLHEAEHIPMFHPNVRMKIYSKAQDGSDTQIEAVGIRKIGAVIEYK